MRIDSRLGYMAKGREGAVRLGLLAATSERKVSLEGRKEGKALEAPPYENRNKNCRYVHLKRRVSFSVMPVLVCHKARGPRMNKQTNKKRNQPSLSVCFHFFTSLMCLHLSFRQAPYTTSLPRQWFRVNSK